MGSAHVAFCFKDGLKKSFHVSQQPCGLQGSEFAKKRFFQNFLKGERLQVLSVTRSLS